MAKKASTGGKSGKTSKRTASRSSSGKSRSGAKTEKSYASSAADALLKLLESPLATELLAVGATAALASLTEQRFGSKAGKAAGAKLAVKAAVVAAAGAMGRRIATEFVEIRKSGKAKAAEAE